MVELGVRAPASGEAPIRTRDLIGATRPIDPMRAGPWFSEPEMPIGDIRYAGFALDRRFKPNTTVTLPGSTVTLLNDLHRRIIAARQLAGYHREQLEVAGVDEDVHKIDNAYAAAPSPEGIFESAAKRIESEPVARAYVHPHILGKRILYVNAPARSQGGYDLATERAASGGLAIVEFEGTIDLRNATWLRRLSMTRHKGRQLSRRRIRAASPETGLVSAEAGFFLRSLHRVLAGDYARRLIVVGVDAASPPQVIVENESAAKRELTGAPDLGRPRADLAAIDAAWPDLVPHRSGDFRIDAAMTALRGSATRRRLRSGLVRGLAGGDHAPEASPSGSKADVPGLCGCDPAIQPRCEPVERIPGPAAAWWRASGQLEAAPVRPMRRPAVAKPSQRGIVASYRSWIGRNVHGTFQRLPTTPAANGWGRLQAA